MISQQDQTNLRSDYSPCHAQYRRKASQVRSEYLAWVIIDLLLKCHRSFDDICRLTRTGAHRRTLNR